MGIFNAIGVAGTGVTVYRKWLDAVSDNIANVDNVARTSENAFQARYVAAQEAAQSLMTILGRFEDRIASQLPC